MKIKLYKLLEMIDNGVSPKKVMYDYTIYKLNGENYFEENQEDRYELIEELSKQYTSIELASIEVEILEDTKIKPIETSPANNETGEKITIEGVWFNLNFKEALIISKINEIIKVINKENNNE